MSESYSEKIAKAYGNKPPPAASPEESVKVKMAFPPPEETKIAADSLKKIVEDLKKIQTWGAWKFDYRWRLE